MTHQTTGQREDDGLKQAREKGNNHIITRKEEERGGDSSGGGSAPAPRLSTGSDRIVLDSILSQLRGVIGRYPEPDEEFVFEFDDVATRDVHMVGVRRPLQVEWYVDDDLVREDVLRPWLGYASAEADRVIERRPR